MFIPSPLGIDCGLLDEPKNGFVSLSGTAEGDTATYKCKPGFVLESERENMRVCNHSGNWTGSVLECRSKLIHIFCTCCSKYSHNTVRIELSMLEIDYGPLKEPKNGFILASSTAENDTATY